MKKPAGGTVTMSKMAEAAAQAEYRLAVPQEEEERDPFTTPTMRGPCGSCIEVAEIKPFGSWMLCAKCEHAHPGLSVLITQRDRFQKSAIAWAAAAIEQRKEIERLLGLANFWREDSRRAWNKLSQAEDAAAKKRKKVPK